MLTFANVTLAECVQFACSVPPLEQIAGPDWIKSRDVRFDIVAKAPGGTELDQARVM